MHSKGIRVHKGGKMAVVGSSAPPSSPPNRKKQKAALRMLMAAEQDGEFPDEEVPVGTAGSSPKECSPAGNDETAGVGFL